MEISEKNTSKSLFHTVRMAVWPIEMHELKKFLPMTFMMFAILFNYSAVRSIKDSLVVTNIGPEAISFIKLYMVLPSAILGMLFYSKLCNMMKQDKVFYTIITTFLIFFGLFAFILYPNQDFFHPDQTTIQALAAQFPNFKWFFFIAGQWIYSAFYIFAELWGSMALTLLFWSFANQITASTQAKRFYSMFGFFGNISLILSGASLKFLSQLGDSSVLINGISIMVIAFGIIAMFLYQWMQRHVVNDPELCPVEPKKKKKKAKLTLIESFKLIFSTKYIGYIAILVFSYGLSINLIENIWKAKIREVYPDVKAYAAFMGDYMQWTAVGTMIFMLIGANILRSVRWRTAAMMTPLIFAITGIAFFMFVLFDDTLGAMTLAMFGLNAAAIAVVIGMIQNVLSKATKYSLFDSTKEMAYIPIDDELKTKGKAAVDVVGGRLGKSGGAFIISTLTVLLPSYNMLDFVPILSTIFVIILMGWFITIRALGKEYESLTKDADK